ncbi:PTS system, IIA component [Sulfurovum sp. enrichment culture clone C5]|uniref:PTS system glucose-specific EIIA component n=1 Tax=Sulfurovum sp. enrichment culture clone C5 TaxID=497650 RepID=A0A0S4XNR7_9BACT|nr:PTS system, IIA component [Sulfurovum sp. enrichment culture clone C5]
MFGWLKSKKISIFAPVDGEMVDLDNVPDEVFSARMAGEGMAIKPTSDIFTSPVNGTVSKIFDTNHAYVVKNGELEVIVHIGIDTVNLKGEGFTRIASVGDKVKVGDPIIKVDLPFLEANAKSTITPIVVNSSKISIKENGKIKQGNLIMEAE